MGLVGPGWAMVDNPIGPSWYSDKRAGLTRRVQLGVRRQPSQALLGCLQPCHIAAAHVRLSRPSCNFGESFEIGWEITTRCVCCVSYTICCDPLEGGPKGFRICQTFVTFRRVVCIPFDLYWFGSAPYFIRRVVCIPFEIAWEIALEIYLLCQLHDLL